MAEAAPSTLLAHTLSGRVYLSLPLCCNSPFSNQAGDPYHPAPSPPRLLPARPHFTTARPVQPIFARARPADSPACPGPRPRANACLAPAGGLAALPNGWQARSRPSSHPAGQASSESARQPPASSRAEAGRQPASSQPANQPATCPQGCQASSALCSALCNALLVRYVVRYHSALSIWHKASLNFMCVHIC